MKNLNFFSIPLTTNKFFSFSIKLIQKRLKFLQTTTTTKNSNELPIKVRKKNSDKNSENWRKSNHRNKYDTKFEYIRITDEKNLLDLRSANKSWHVFFYFFFFSFKRSNWFDEKFSLFLIFMVFFLDIQWSCHVYHTSRQNENW